MEIKNRKQRKNQMDGKEMILCTVHRRRISKVGKEYKFVEIGEPFHCIPEICQAYGGPKKYREELERAQEEMQKIADLSKNSSNELSATIEKWQKNTLDDQGKS